jgi:hypothetical protein
VTDLPPDGAPSTPGAARARAARGPRAARAARWAAFLLAFAVNVAVLLAPDPDVPTPSTPGFDKVVHAGVFAALTWTGLRLGWPARWYVPAVLAWAVVSEVLQAVLLPRRTGDPRDAVADAVGVLAATALHAAAVRRRRRRAPPGT